MNERLVASWLCHWLELEESADAKDLPYRELAVAQEIGRGRRKLNQPLRAILRGLAPPGLWEKLRSRWAPPGSSLFLLIGDPGSGKSLALRQHARDVLSSFRPGGSVPLYLNLHHWRQEGWNDYKPPPPGEVEQSLVTFAERQLEVAAVVHGPKVFSMLRAQGRWIFLFDSFDEMPALLASRSPGNLVRALLAGIRQFVAGGAGRAGCGVLATRDFRRNLSSLALGYTPLRIHPFTDRDLQALLKGRNSVPTVKAFFKADTGLATVARNPFVGMMLAGYLLDHKQAVLGGKQPTRAEVYEHFMSARLQAALAIMRQKGRAPPLEELRHLLSRVAASLLEESAERQGGLEFEAAKLCGQNWSLQTAADCVEALQQAGLLRGAVMAPAVSFSHRRFADYFAACSLADNDAALEKAGEVLRNDNHPWRDALVVYCDKEEVAFLRGVVRQSWPLIAPLLERAELTPRQKTDARVGLDFLLEAVRGRPEAMGAYQEELADFMVNCARDPRQRLLKVRQAAEWAGLLSGPTLTRAWSAVLERGSWRVMEGALFSCRFNQKPTLTLIRRITYVLELNPLRLIFDRSGIVSSLRRSQGFQAAWRRAQWRRVDLIALLVTIPTAAALTKSPSIILFYAVLIFWQQHMVWNEPVNKLPPQAWFLRWRRDMGFDLGFAHIAGCFGLGNNLKNWFDAQMPVVRR